MTNRIKPGTDADLVGGLPASTDPEKLGADMQRLQEALNGIEVTDPAVRAFIESIQLQSQHVGHTTSGVDMDGPDGGESQDADTDEGVSAEASGDVEGSEERLDERLAACLEELRRDFDRGIVLIDENAGPTDYTRALRLDKTAGQKWETLKVRLLAKGAELLKKAAAMPGGACLVGVYENGELAIRQRSQDIMSARWTKMWIDGSSDKGELRLLPYAEAKALPDGRWAKPAEIIQAVKAAGYHAPVYPGELEKKGLVAASEVVTGGHYVMSPDGDGRRSAIFECDEDIDDESMVYTVAFHPENRGTVVLKSSAFRRLDHCGAVLWLRG
ncbi:MAG: hypothetical protein WC777_01635 [Candidatus Gracilibacteria bacterium]|jgi:hypothetical protein